MQEEKTLQFIEDNLRISKKPICLCSFGKDSIVLLHLILRIKKIPVIFWRESHYQKKFLYAQKIMTEWDLEVYDYPPTFVDYFQNDDYFEIFNFYYVNGKDCIVMYMGTRNYNEKDKDFLCAIKDCLLRPKVPSYQFNWDYIFHGHKQSDPVYIVDKMELKDIVSMHDKTMVLPIKDWTDKDIWDYIHKYKLPYDRKRYDKEDESVNPDKFPTCHDCLDYKTLGKKVYCPKINDEIMNLGKRYIEHEKLKYFLLNNNYINKLEV